jgi:hypothetical protein
MITKFTITSTQLSKTRDLNPTKENNETLENVSNKKKHKY